MAKCIWVQISIVLWQFMGGHIIISQANYVTFDAAAAPGSSFTKAPLT
jgi:hypothetical protein